MYAQLSMSLIKWHLRLQYIRKSSWASHSLTYNRNLPTTAAPPWIYLPQAASAGGLAPGHVCAARVNGPYCSMVARDSRICCQCATCAERTTPLSTMPACSAKEQGPCVCSSLNMWKCRPHHMRMPSSSTYLIQGPTCGTDITIYNLWEESLPCVFQHKQIHNLMHYPWIPSRSLYCVRNKLQLTHSETARVLRNAIIVLISFSFVSQFLFDMLVKCSSGKYLQPRCSLASVVIVARRRTARDLFGAVVLRDADNTGIASH